MALGPNEVLVRIAATDSFTSPDIQAADLELLDDSERERYRRFLFDRDRNEYLVAHALLRRTLSLCAPVSPEAWRFTRNAYGCPAIEDAPDLPLLRFNLSHTRGLTACVVTKSVDVGIDIEWLDRALDPSTLMSYVFSPEEVRCLQALPAPEQRSRFFEYWTLKEAYIKARGLGLSLPLREFTILFVDDTQISVTFQPSLADDASAWQFHLMSPTPAHRLALAVRRGFSHDLHFNIETSVP